MLRELTQYYRPKDLNEALTLLSQSGVRIVPLAGGTELLGRKDHSIEAVVDLQALGLNYIGVDGNGLHIGAMENLRRLGEDETVRSFAAGLLSRCAQLSAQHTERVSATVGGTIAAGAAWNDLLPTLLVTDAWVTLRALEAKALVPLGAFLPRRTNYLTQGTLITELMIPSQRPDARFAYQRVSRTPRDRAIINVAVRAALQDGAMRHVRVAVGGAADHALRLHVVEAMLEGQQLDAALLSRAADAIQKAVTPPSDHLASSEYRREMVGVLLRRAIRQLGENYA